MTYISSCSGVEVDVDGEDEDETIFIASLHDIGPTLWRKRWDSAYLCDLAEREYYFWDKYHNTSKL